MRRTLLLSLAIVAAVPAAAGAATVRTETYMECNGDPACAKYQAGNLEIQLLFDARPGEANRVTTEPAADGRVLVTDAGAPLEAGPNCESAGPNQVLCRFPRAAYFALGDGDDTIAFSLGPRSYVAGGPGADTIAGGAPGEHFDGGAGADRIDGGGGDDTFSGSVEGQPADVLDGGDGTDVVSYVARRQPFTASLVPGAAGNPDALTRIEGLVGGPGDDVLVGSTGDDRLAGGDGDDELDGGLGDDHLAGGGGRDALDAGPGDDVLAAYDATRDTLTCGTGTDRVLDQIDTDDFYDELNWRGADPIDRLARSCERTALRGTGGESEQYVVDPRVRVLGRRVRVVNPCTTIAPRPCRGVIRIARVRRGFRSGTRFVTLRLPRVPGATIRVEVNVRFGDEERGGGWTTDRRTPVG